MLNVFRVIGNGVLASRFASQENAHFAVCEALIAAVEQVREMCLLFCCVLFALLLFCLLAALFVCLFVFISKSR